MSTNSVLDNPIWNALNTGDVLKNKGNEHVRHFDINTAPFIGMANWNEDSQRKIIELDEPEREWFLLIADTINLIDELVLLVTMPIHQFICTNLNRAPIKDNQIQLLPLNESHIEEMITLTALTKPGPFSKDTIRFGNYHGIFEDGKLVAMGGERMHVANYTEISAICTHPNAQGKGYAASITQFLAAAIIEKGQIPFLHARTDNEKAIEVYKRLGFELRTTVYFFMFKVK
jgi:predicted GNAT family acetyltransferase